MDINHVHMEIDYYVPLTGAIADATNRLTFVWDKHDVVKQLLVLFKESENDRQINQIYLVLYFNRETLFYFSTY